MYKKTQSGFTIVELSVVLIISLIVSYLYFVAEVEKNRDGDAINLGQNMLTAANSVNSTLGEYYGNFVGATAGVQLQITPSNGLPLVTIADPSKPTVTELKQLGFFPSNFSTKATNGGNIVVQVNKVPAGCTAPSCNIEAVVCIDKPIVKANNPAIVDAARLGLAIKAIGSDGGGSTIENPNQIAGLGGSWSVPNNVVAPNNRAGVLCARAGYGSSAFAAFFRIDGTHSMRADANIGGNSLINTKQLVTSLKAVDDACTDPGAISGGIVNGIEIAMVCRANKWKPQGGNYANAGDTCSPDGITATSLTTNEQLICKNGRYIKLVNVIAKNIEVSRLNVTDGQTVTKPTCDVGGTPDYTLVLNRTAVDVTVAPPYQSQYITTTDNGASWGIVLRLRSDTGSETSGNNYSLSALMKLECKY